MTKKSPKKANESVTEQKDAQPKDHDGTLEKTVESSETAANTQNPKNDSVDKTEAPPKPLDVEKYAALEKKYRELQDQYLRKAADFDNYRKRMIKEKQEAIDFANGNLLTDLLQILDNFDRAIEAGGKQESSDSALLQGVKMIRSSLDSMLESKYGLTYYPAQDQPFDPAVHEAVASNPSPDVKEPTVGAELQKGYKLKERILRSAKVMVLMPESKETAEEKSTEN